MPDTTLAAGLIVSANALVDASGRRKPAQASLRRAVSSAYYAAFHQLARSCADALVGTSRQRRPNRAWVEVYRGIEHGAARAACDGAGNVGFPAGVKTFADAFRQLQIAREAADYDPMIRLGKVEVQGFIALAEDGIAALGAVSRTDRIAFATWVLITTRGARHARNRVRAGNTRAVGA
ncbi:MAG: hypothetical protein H3C51_01525 [Rubellimicrobium sp.]|nr:hypothetical protein [Rubellimicrobium sp.]